MPYRNPSLHGMAPDKCPLALLLLDVINDLDFPGAEEIRKEAPKMAARLARLKREARNCGVPVVYVNDNYGRWQSDFNATLKHCLEATSPGKPVAEQLLPEQDDYFVLKPKHSGFFSTTLDVLLDYLQTRALIITGIAGNICVLFTANDAYMRDFEIYVPRDCIVSNTRAENDQSLEMIEKILKADTSPSDALDVRDLICRLQSPGE